MISPPLPLTSVSVWPVRSCMNGGTPAPQSALIMPLVHFHVPTNFSASASPPPPPPQPTAASAATASRNRDPKPRLFVGCPPSICTSERLPRSAATAPQEQSSGTPPAP